MRDTPPSDNRSPEPASFGEAKYRVLFETTELPIFIEYEDTVVECNDAALRLFGYSRAQMLGTHPSKFSPEYQPNGRRSEAMAAEIIAAVMAGAPQRFEWRHRRADGSVFDAEISLNAFDFDGRRYRQAVLHDLSEQKQAQQVLRESERRYRLLADYSTDLISCHTAEGLFRYASPAAQSLVGWAPERLIGRSLYDFVHPEDEATLRQAHRPLAQRDSSATTRYRFRHSDGSYVWFETVALAVDLAVWGDDASFVCNSRDIGERIAAEQELLAAETAAAAQRSEQRALQRSERQFRNLVETTQDWFWETDPKGRFTYVSPYVRELLGYTPQEMLGRLPFDFMDPAEARRMSAIVRTLVRRRRPIRLLENTLLARDGRAVVHETSGIPFFAKGGALRGYRGINRDITRRIEGQQKLRLAAQILEQTPEGVLITDTDTRVLSVNLAFEHTTGYEAAEILGKTPHLLASGRHDQAFYRRMWEEINGTGSWQGEIWNRRKNGDIYPEWLNITAIRDQSGAITHYAAIFSDISTQEHVRKRLHNLAYYDALTELPNRELFHDRLTNALITAQRERHSVALLFFDMDRFKNINDALGHTAGDELLKAVATRLHTVVRESDTVARLGGDEFTIILSNIRKPSEAGIVAAKVLDAFRQRFHIAGQELFITTSIGVALYPQDANDAELLLRNADTAMYRAKEMGRNNYQFYDSHMSSRFAERIELENDLRKAVEKNGLHVVYQPQLSIGDRRIVGFEALLRWEHPVRGTISPDRFIPVAEESGLILALGIWVLEQACRQARHWLDQGRRDFRVAVNVSAVQLRMQDFVGAIVETLQRTQCPAANLELEITESLLMENIDTATRTLLELSRLGIAIAIDDFGTGYSSLGYLKRLTIDKLKIDKSFINDLLTDRSGAEITATVVMMAHNLGLRVIAEGVESEAQLAYLTQLGCDEIQGYLFGKPLPAAELDALWERHGAAQ